MNITETLSAELLVLCGPAFAGELVVEELDNSGNGIPMLTFCLIDSAESYQSANPNTAFSA